MLANRVGSAGHGRMLAEALPPGLRWYGALPREEDFALPSRHLGLVQGEEIADLDARLDAAAEAIAGTTEGELAGAGGVSAPAGAGG